MWGQSCDKLRLTSCKISMKNYVSEILSKVKMPLTNKIIIYLHAIDLHSDI